ncbi:MAG: hypothetical protein RJA35_613 [Actinomycetota bacterium]|jgi:signal transduction histidine kinase
MSKQEQLVQTQANRVWEALGLRASWSWGFAATAFIFYGVAAFAFDNIRLENFSLGWVVVDLGTYVEAFLLIALALRALPAFAWETPGVGRITNLAIACVVGSIKNTTVWFAATAFGIDSTPWDGITRIIGGSALAAGTFVLWVSISASRNAHKRVMANLEESRNQLLALREQVKQQASDAQSELIAQTQATLLPKLKQIQDLLGDSADAGQVISQLQAVTETDVRPLSHKFQEAAELLAAAPRPAQVWNRREFSYPERFELRNNINPLIIAAIVIPAQFLSLHTFYGMEGITKLAPSMLAALISLAVAKFVYPAGREYGQKVGITLVILTAILVGLPQLLWLMMISPVDPPGGALGAVTTAVITTLSFAWYTFVRISHDSQHRSEEELAEVNQNIRRELAVFNQALWLQKRRWGYLLHGTVQAALTVSIARLHHLEQVGVNLAGERMQRDDVIAKVRDDLKKIVSVITDPPEDHINLDVELLQLAKTWQGVLDISLSITNKAHAALEGSQNLQMAVNEICREAATNAYRHGGATTMSVKVDQTRAEELELTIINNGRAPENLEPGMGLQMLDALTMRWNLRYRKGSGLTTLTASLAVGN